MSDVRQYVVGAIEGLTTIAGSGLAMLIVRDDDGERHAIPCDTAPTMRALSSLVPSLLRGRAAVRLRLVDGVRVRYQVDELGILSFVGRDEDDHEPPAMDDAS